MKRNVLPSCLSWMLCLCLLPLTTLAEENQTPSFLIETGFHFFNQLPTSVKSGSKWWAFLREDTGHYVMKEVIIDVKQVKDPLTDSGLKKTGKNVTLRNYKINENETNKPLFLVNHFPSAMPSRITTWLDEPIYFWIGKNQSIKTPAGVFSFRCIGDEQNAKIIFQESIDETQTRKERETPEQVIFETTNGLDFTEERGPSLLWAGDMDGDKKLDLLMDLSNRSFATKLTLFLSTQANAQSEYPYFKPIEQSYKSGC